MEGNFSFEDKDFFMVDALKEKYLLGMCCVKGFFVGQAFVSCAKLIWNQWTVCLGTVFSSLMYGLS